MNIQKNSINMSSLASAFIALNLFVMNIYSQSCPEPNAADFTEVKLGNDGLNRPVHLAVVPDGRVFVGEMEGGNIKLLKPGATDFADVGQVKVRYDNEDGLLGIAAPPDFATSHFLYVFYTDPSSTIRAHVLSRYVIQNDTLVQSSKTEILRFSRVEGDRYHAAGGMVFDNKGNLYISTGDDTEPSSSYGFGPTDTTSAMSDGQKSASNTNDLRGKVLRIHPEVTAVAGKYYSIPAGNFREAFSTFYSAASLDSIRPEIYAMGMRNPYRLTVDNQTGWVIWGEVGPDARQDDPGIGGKMGYDELNVATKPGFFGWPYCNGNNFAYTIRDWHDRNNGKGTLTGKSYDCAATVNESKYNTGVKKLPPAQPAVVWYAAGDNHDFPWVGGGQTTAIGGPMYRYDKNLISTIKFPPQYDGRLHFYDWSRGFQKLLSFDNNGKVISQIDLPGAKNLGNALSSQYGPDGALYVLRYATNGYSGGPSGLFRIEYHGTIDNACAPVVGISKENSQSHLSLHFATTLGSNFIDIPTYTRGVEIYNLEGKKVWAYSRANTDHIERVSAPEKMVGKMFYLKFFK